MDWGTGNGEGQMDNGQRAVDGQWPIAVVITLLLVLKSTCVHSWLPSVVL